MSRSNHRSPHYRDARPDSAPENRRDGPSPTTDIDERPTSVEDYSGHNLDEAAVTLLEAGAHGTDLSDADLHGADLHHADLHGANLQKTNLCGARMNEANLETADLRGADLRAARLGAARLAGAKLYGALFDQATELPFSKDDAIRAGMIYLEVAPTKRLS